MNERTTLPAFAATLRAIPRTFSRTWKGLVAADLVFKGVGALLTMAFCAVVLTEVMRLTGRSAVTNTDIAALLTYRMGFFLAFAGAAGGLFLTLVEQAVLMAVAAVLYYRPGTGGRDLVKASAAALQRILRLAGLLLLAALGIALPPAAAVGLLYKLILGGHDINYYLSARPPAFLAVAAASAVLLFAAAAALAAFYVRALLALPILLFERARPAAAVRESIARTRGTAWRLAGFVAAWHLGWSAISVLGLIGGRHLAGLAFASVDTTAGALLASASALAVLALAGAVLSFGAWAGHALLVLRLYNALHPAGARPEPAPEPPVEAGRGASPVRWTFAGGSVVLLAVLGIAAVLSSRVGQLGRTQISAHRGYSKVAPENTLAAVRKSIEAGAEWAEIDVQGTADGVVVVTHDRDLMRMARDPRRLTEIPFAELRAVDVGSPFSPEFAGERVPTLEEVFDLARGRIKLNIELKYYGDDPRLAPEVARLVRKHGFEKECFVASLDFPQLQAAKRENPALRTGAIVAAKVGDLTGLDAEVLSVNAGLVDFWFLRAARRAGKEVHAWTVDDPRVAKVLMGRGVANLITNDPAALVRARSEWEALPTAEKILLTVRHLLGVKAGRADQVASQGDL